MSKPENDNRVGSSELVRLHDAKEIIAELIAIAPTPHCELFSHGKKDRHGWGEPCPCVERYERKLERARKFLQPNAEVSHPAGRKPESEGMK